MNRPKAIGTAAETAVVRVARAAGFLNADRLTLSGSADRGDVRLTAHLEDGVILEVKGGQAAKTASDALVERWLAETEAERANARAAVGVLVLQRSGFGAPRAGRWWALMRAADYTCLAFLRGKKCPPEDYAAGNEPVRVHFDHALSVFAQAGFR